MTVGQILVLLIGITLIVIAGRIRQRSLAKAPPARGPRTPDDQPGEAAHEAREPSRPGLSPVQETQGAPGRLPEADRGERAVDERTRR